MDLGSEDFCEEAYDYDEWFAVDFSAESPEGILNALKTIHSGITGIRINQDGECEITFEGGSNMITSEFRKGTKTRNLMETYEQMVG